MVALSAVFGDDSIVSSLTFEKDIRPILKAQCFHCHGEDDELHGGLDLRLVRLMRAGGDSGEQVLSEDVAASYLWQRIESDEMPEGPKKLTAAQKQTIRQWLEQGSQTARAEPEHVEDARFSLEELSHWAYQPVRRPTVPEVAAETSTVIDHFIANGHEKLGVGFSPSAQKRTLIRRLSFDITGLPPAERDVAQFISDTRPDAYDRLVDRMLASPQFGVRWGRHWLDVAGYAETNGGGGSDTKREHAWRYRDYVIDAFNHSKPINQFLQEQLAGDELLEGDIDISNPRHLELLAATGFLRMAPDATQTQNTPENRNNAVAESIKVISTAMLGITVGCAQCHDHKYDPISIDDYYRFRAVFDPAMPLEHWQQPNSILVDFTPPQVQSVIDEIEAEAKALDDDLTNRRNELAQSIQELKLDDVPACDRDATREAVLTEPAERTEEQKRLLKLYPMVKPIGHIIGLLVEYDMPSYRMFEKEKEGIAAVRAKKPPKTMVWAARERKDIVPVSHVLFRGNLASKRDEVQPAELSVLQRHGRDRKLPSNSEETATTGRRLSYAKQLTDGAHPLASRVFVNRIWQHYMGKGLVATPGDFGISGEVPSHPDLLDWLATDFVQHGWDQKRLHRMILLSRTYQQVSTRTPQLDKVDPENRFYARMSLRRLEAEAVRDAILFVADELSDELGGPSLPVTENPEGKVVIGKRKIRDGLKAEVTGNELGTRRSVYIEVSRRLPLNVLATFDQPVMNPNCSSRPASTVATQSLWFLNDRMILELSNRYAAKLLVADYSGGKGVDSGSETVIERLFTSLFAQQPTVAELHTCNKFLQQQRQHLMQNEAKPEVADRQAMAALVQTLVASNRFLYVD